MQLASGVATTTWQDDRTLLRRNCNGFRKILNIPAAFVMVEATTFPPHVTWTNASADHPTKRYMIK